MGVPRTSGDEPDHESALARAAHWQGLVWAASAVVLIATVLPSLHGSLRQGVVPERQVVADQHALAQPQAIQPVQGVIAGSTPTGTATAASGSASASAAAPPVSTLAADGIPITALGAYELAAQHIATTDPACGLPWPLLAAIGRVESDHGRFAGAVLRSDGTSSRRVIGIRLDGNGTALIRDTDDGRLDGDTVYDRAVGPMQFIPSTWASYGVDGNADGLADPFNIFDAAAAAAHYLCVAGGDLTTMSGQTRAVLAYNHSSAYLATVLGLEQTYASGVPGVVVPTGPVPVGPPAQAPTVPPVDPGPPRGIRRPHPEPGSPPAASSGNPSGGGKSSSSSSSSSSPDPTLSSSAGPSCPSSPPSLTDAPSTDDPSTNPSNTSSSADATSSDEVPIAEPSSPVDSSNESMADPNDQVCLGPSDPTSP